MSVALSRRGLLTAAATLAGASYLAPLRFIHPALAAGPTTITAGSRVLDVNGRSATVLGLRQPDGAHGLVIDVSQPFRVNLVNEIGQPTLIHWHGLTPPYQQDGVPGISGPAIPPGGQASYDFPLAFPGTFWMHSHQGLQEQTLLAAPLIIHGPEDRRKDRQELVLMLHDFTFKSPQEIYTALRQGTSAETGTPTGQTPPKAGDGMAGMSMGNVSGMAEQPMPGMNQKSGMGAMGMATPNPEPKSASPGAMPGMNMGRHGGTGASGIVMDLNDVAFDAFLANDRTLSDPEIIRVEPGGRVLLRIINGSAASNFFVELGGLQADLVAVDGHAVQPVRSSRFPIAIAQRIDLAVQLPRDQNAWPVLAVLEGERRRTGIVLASTKARINKIGDTASDAVSALNFAFEGALRARHGLPARKADRVHQLELTGSMQGYVWGLNGHTYPDAPPLMVQKGERVEIAMRNTTMMSHPMHLHGHFFQVVAVNGRRFAGAIRDTVLVPPMTTVTIAFDADNPGKWAFHCHNLYHMEAGMMTTVQYATL
jgi:FtsP/CotA-like multicopper oxidase with cupredoxin domain